jgi:hypothetical protein
MAKTTTFLWHDDKGSDVDTKQIVRIGEEKDPSDIITYTNFGAENTTSASLPEVGVFIPYAWARATAPDGHDPHGFHYESMRWDNTRMAFLDPNYNETGQSVWLTPTISSFPNGHVMAGSVADQSDTHLFPESSKAAGSGRPLETLQPTDQLPFADLGSFAPDQSKQFDMTWTATWETGGNFTDHGAVRVGGYIATIVPDAGHAATTGSVGSVSLFNFDG